MYLKYFLAPASLLSFLCALLLFASIKQDERILDKAIAGQITAQPNPGELVAELNRWVYNNQGFAKNKEYFIFRELGPTPVQVLQSGGDCSDKSRLLAALLRRFDMDATLVMLHACEGCKATHTVVEARYESGRMAADPVYDMVFPAGNGKFYGIRDLREDPSKLLSRHHELVAQRGPADRIGSYKRETESYSWPKTINWDKNVVLQSVAAVMEMTGTDPYLVMRPHFLEDPKLFLMYLSLFFGVTTGCGAWLLRKKAGSARPLELAREAARRG
jgi:hypothetical protein